QARFEKLLPPQVKFPCFFRDTIDWQQLLKTRLQIGRNWEHGVISRNCLSIAIGMIYRKAIQYRKMACQDIFHKLSY
ncbi:MAG: hypothetical protein WC657_07160, partial [Candidatus Paceibacterota bacterium]